MFVPGPKRSQSHGKDAAFAVLEIDIRFAAKWNLRLYGIFSVKIL